MTATTMTSAERELRDYRRKYDYLTVKDARRVVRQLAKEGIEATINARADKTASVHFTVRPYGGYTLETYGQAAGWANL